MHSARANLAQALERSAVNRAYYAMFYAVLALLASRAEETSRHSGAISRFDRDYIKPGTLPRDFSRWLHDAFTYRQNADYGTEFAMTRESIRELAHNAESFVAGVTEHLRASGILPPA